MAAGRGGCRRSRRQPRGLPGGSDGPAGLLPSHLGRVPRLRLAGGPATRRPGRPGTTGGRASVGVPTWRGRRRGGRTRHRARPGRPARRRRRHGSGGARCRRPGPRSRRSSARHSTASAPWPTWGTISSGASTLGDAGRPSPSRSRADGGHHDGAAVGHLLEPGVDVAAELHEREVGTERRRAGPAGGPSRWPRSRPAPARRGDGRRGRRGDRRARARPPAPDRRRWSDGQVLGRVHREVGPAVEHGLLHLLHEHALAAEGADRRVGAGVARGLHQDQLDVQAGVHGLQQRGHVLGLPAGQGTAPGRQAQRRAGSPGAQGRSNRSRRTSA